MSKIKYFFLMAKFVSYMVFTRRRLNKAFKTNNRKEMDILQKKLGKLYAKAVFDGTGSELIIDGIEKIDLNETYLVVSNHLSNCDIPAILEAFPKRIAFVSKKEVRKIPYISYWMDLGGAIFLDRENVRNSIEQINKGIDTLNSSVSMCVFPEGTRSVTGEIGEFKKGSFKLAIKSKTKILPVVLNDTRSIYEDNNNSFKKGQAKVTFLDSIDIFSLTSEECNNIHNIVRDRIKEVYEKNIIKLEV